MVDKIEALASAERAGLMRAALKGKVSEVNAEVEELRRQVAAREQDRDFFQAEDDKAAAVYEGIVSSLVADGMAERKVRDMLDTRVRMSVDANVEVQVPTPGSGRVGRASAPRRQRTTSKADPAGTEPGVGGQPGEPAGEGQATPPARPDERDADRGARPGTDDGAEDGGLSLPPMGGE